MQNSVFDEDIPIIYIPKFREYGIKILDGGTSLQLIKYCPWCGAKLPISLRDKWFDEIYKLNLEPESPEIPEKYLTDEWWKSNS
jgi:hypothetical protein